jgi:MFS family permease
LPLAYTPLVLVAMNVVYSLSAYPFGRLSDRMSHRTLLLFGLVLLIAADLALAHSADWLWVWLGISLWGLHLGITQGLFAKLVADTAPDDLRGTAYGFFNLIAGSAMLIASVLAGLLWDGIGAFGTFVAGAVFSALAVLMLLAGRGPSPSNPP